MSVEMRLREDVSTAITEYGMVLLDERTGRYWQINPVGTVILEHLAHGVDAVVGSLTSRFDVDSDQARADVDAFLRQLSTNGLVAT
ncbi:lasso peptide biosynthesis PqqD family chaperone [Streptomyces alboflavus]|uniref:lasso peptide biosynthesis PqqD family chaperone n=1 Tax=Streptomyces alboflavus TaxID=67267 RepID=UPI001F26F64F|nr:lasso peptide biosynthesis PqqD family chaperone [Streptomyces alboflavus]